MFFLVDERSTGDLIYSITDTPQSPITQLTTLKHGLGGLMAR